MIEGRRALAQKCATITRRAGITPAYATLRRLVVPDALAVLTYHRVGAEEDEPWMGVSIPADAFESQMKWLASQCSVVPLIECLDRLKSGKPLPRRCVAVTFDDGYHDNYARAFPILKRYGIPALVNVVTGNVRDQCPFWWDRVKYALWYRDRLRRSSFDEQSRSWAPGSNRNVGRDISETVERLKLLTAAQRENEVRLVEEACGAVLPGAGGPRLVVSPEEIHEMAASGIDFGAHTESHCNVAIETDHGLAEMCGSKATLEEWLGREVRVFCYPNGDLTPAARDAVQQAGFGYALTADPGFVRFSTPALSIPRVPGGWTIECLEFFLSGLFVDGWRLARSVGLLNGNI